MLFAHTFSLHWTSINLIGAYFGRFLRLLLCHEILPELSHLKVSSLLTRKRRPTAGRSSKKSATQRKLTHLLLLQISASSLFHNKSENKLLHDDENQPDRSSNEKALDPFWVGSFCSVTSLPNSDSATQWLLPRRKRCWQADRNHRFADCLLDFASQRLHVCHQLYHHFIDTDHWEATWWEMEHLCHRQ